MRSLRHRHADGTAHQHDEHDGGRVETHSHSLLGNRDTPDVTTGPVVWWEPAGNLEGSDR